MSTTIAVILDTRRRKKNNKYPVKLRVNYQRVNEYYPTIFDLCVEDYDKLTAPRISADLQKIKNDLKKIERDADSLSKELEQFTFSEFEKRLIVSNRLFRQRKRKQDSTSQQNEEFDLKPFHKKFSILLVTDCEMGTIAWSYREYIKKLLTEGRIGTADNYHCSYVSLTNVPGKCKVCRHYNFVPYGL